MSCFDAKDFDLDKLNYDNLQPQFHLPLLSDTLYISDAFDGDNLEFSGGQGYLVFDAGHIEMPEVTDIFTLDNQNVSLDIGLPLPNGVAIPAGVPFPEWDYSSTVTGDIDFNSPDIAPKSITFASGTLRLNNTKRFPGGTLTVKITNLKKGTTPFSANINVTATGANAPISLAGYSLTVGNDKQLDIEYTYRTGGFTTSSAINSIELGFDINISNISISEARGYFGKHTEYARQTIDIGDFNDINGSWELKEASIALEIQNSIQLPLRVVIDTVRSYTSTASGARPAEEKVRIDSLDLGNTGLTQDTLAIPGELLSVLPKKMDVVVKIQSNPNGKTSQDNIISSAGSASASAKVLVPLKIKGVNITLKDTLDFDVSDISFNNLKLLLNVKNSLPFGVELQCTLLKKDTKESLGELFNAPVVIPAGNTTPAGNGESNVTSPSDTHKFIEVSNSMAKKMKDAGRITVSFTVKTNDANNYVRITDKDNVSLKIGVSANINAGDIL